MDDETAYNIQLIVSELVTNAIRYGRSPLELRLIHDRTLTCEMRDAGSAAPTCAMPPRPTRAGEACSSSRSWLRHGGPASARWGRRSGPSRHCPAPLGPRARSDGR
ncbi:ATP-binding protein [Streptomyces sp. MS1.AVA.1]|uniref:ATP-binding protein n=1 Tax=Streptomyces machairae TaxID=3134109 RepID=A0ABU8UFL1_9ACTN